MANSNDQEAKKQGTIPNKGSLQAYIQNFTLEAIDSIVEIMRTSRNENLKMGAAKVIIDKSIADLKAVEVGGTNGQPIKLTLIGGADISEYIKSNASSTTSSTGGLTQIQSISVAQESKENNNSDITTGKVEPV